MTELSIPDAVWVRVVGAYGYDESHEDWPRLSAAIEAAAPLIVAAELERLAAQWDAERRDIRRDGDMRMAAAAGHAIRRLRARATELRDGAR